jgi:hypothetical protein
MQIDVSAQRIFQKELYNVVFYKTSQLDKTHMFCMSGKTQRYTCNKVDVCASFPLQDQRQYCAIH